MQLYSTMFQESVISESLTWHGLGDHLFTKVLISGNTTFAVPSEGKTLIESRKSEGGRGGWCNFVSAPALAPRSCSFKYNPMLTSILVLCPFI